MILSDAATIGHYTRAGVWGLATIDEIFRKTARSRPDGEAVRDAPNRAAITHGEPRRLTYGELDAAVDRLVGHFASLGLVSGDIIATQLPNTVEQILVLLAASRSGIVISPLPLMWREFEINSALPMIAPKAIISVTDIAGRNHADMMRYAAFETVSVRYVLAFGDDVPDGVAPLDWVLDGGGSTHDTTPATITANDVFTICWAGGNHPGACPVPRSHNQWIAAGLMNLLESHIGQGATILNPYPLAGLVPISVFFMSWILSGGTLMLHHPFDFDVFVAQMGEEKIDFVGLPPSVIDAIKAEGAFAGDRPHPRSLACLWPTPYLPENAHARVSRLPMPVIDIRAFGELAYVARKRVGGERPALIAHGDCAVPAGAAGGPVLLTTRVRGSATTNGSGKSLLAGDLMIKSAMMFDAYFPSAVPGGDDPTLERDSSGFVNTGMRCRFVGSSKPSLDCVRRHAGVIYHGGMSISATELDRLYSEHESLSDAAVFAFGDPIMGERIMAAVVPSPGKTISLADFNEYLTARKVASYKLPERLVTVKAIPRNEHGEVLRDLVLDQV
jgi:non-ribosomal peptide synthetase component E (peptide arylation enzyme)